MQKNLAWMLAIVVLLAGPVALTVPRPACGEDFRGTPDSPAGEARQDIVISLPFERRLRESVRDGGHQPWRSDARIAAMVELRSFVPALDEDATAEATTCRVVEEGADGEGRSTACVEKQLDAPYWEFQHPVAVVHMFRNAGDVWIATEIVIGDRTEPPSGR